MRHFAGINMLSQLISLVRIQKADIEMYNNKGQTPLMVAADCGNTLMAEVLLSSNNCKLTLNVALFVYKRVSRRTSCIRRTSEASATRRALHPGFVCQDCRDPLQTWHAYTLRTVVSSTVLGCWNSLLCT
jgi:ankyrin repeat protein